MIEFRPERQKKVFIEKGQQDPLMAKNIALPSMILMPGASWNLLSSLFGNRIIHENKEDRMLFDLQFLEEVIQGNLGNLLHGPDVLSQESSKAGERSVQKGPAERLNHRGSVNFLAQLNKADNKG
jgi:hypothetical protein